MGDPEGVSIIEMQRHIETFPHVDGKPHKASLSVVKLRHSAVGTSRIAEVRIARASEIIVKANLVDYHPLRRLGNPRFDMAGPVVKLGE